MCFYNNQQLLLYILKMEDNRHQDFSPSTLYRYNRAQKKQQLPLYLHFKKEYENFINQSKINTIKSIYQHGICGRNKAGNTVVVDRIGNIKIQGLHKVLEDEQLVGYINQRLVHLSEKVLHENEQLVWIIDLSGKIMQLASKKILEALQKIIFHATKFFPLMLHKLIFVNTPMLFDTIWTKIANNIPKQTQQKIIMIADEVQNLYQFAQQEILPQFLGGDLDEETFLYGKKQNEQKQEQSQEQQVDFASLKQALGGLKIGGGGPNNKSVLQTPLNTEADDK